MARDYTDITLIVDRSSSMNSMVQGVIDGINNFVDEQRATPGDGCWSFVQFDDAATHKGAGEDFPHVVLNAVPQDHVPRLTTETYKPRGSTALFDAVCMTIVATGLRLAALPEDQRPDKVVMVIMTDGENNSSREYTLEKMNEMISHQRAKYNWKFLFLAANQDAMKVGAAYGIARGASNTYVPGYAGAVGAIGLASAGIRSWKADGNPTAEVLLSSAAPDKVEVNVTVSNGN
jgi:hypothetical protein